jgi:hypothetical protein
MPSSLLQASPSQRARGCDWQLEGGGGKRSVKDVRSGSLEQFRKEKEDWYSWFLEGKVQEVQVPISRPQQSLPSSH